MIEKIYIVRHGKYISRPSERYILNQLHRIPAQLGHHQLVLCDHTIHHHFLDGICPRTSPTGLPRDPPLAAYGEVRSIRIGVIIDKAKGLIFKSEIGPG